jgi:hypothetical protein
MPDRSTSTAPVQKSRGVLPRELVVFYRSCGQFSPAGKCWHLQVRGSVLAASEGRLRKRALLQLFKRVVKPDQAQDARQRFQDRTQLFLQDKRKGKSVAIALAERHFTLPDSLPSGEVEATLTLPEADLASTLQQDRFGRRFVTYCSSLPEEDQRLFVGQVELIAPEGISVISDVDDTIKLTDVGNRRELLANTFTREFRSIPGMRELYQRWAGAGVSFHYVSASPWPLYTPLVQWLDADGFPPGTMHLRHMRLRDLRSDRKREGSFRNKRSAIETLLRLYPQRRFILCGDSGERDAELYSGIAKDFGDQILHIAIRDCGAGHGRAEQPAQTWLEGLPRDRWTVFTESEELGHLIEAVAASGPGGVTGSVRGAS